jgi:fatty acid desaturase
MSTAGHSASRLFRSAHGALPNVLALAYTLVGYALGVLLLTLEPWWANLAGVLLTGHTLVYAAFFVHEFAHQSIFRSPQASARWGESMSWIAGSCYAPFAALRRKHMHHHIDRADVVIFDYKAFLRGAAPWQTRFVLALEWAYIPAIELLMHGYVMLLPFLERQRKADRPRMLAIVGVRAAAFAILGWYAPKALLLYALAYMIMLHVLRFTDAFQHTYDAFVAVEGDRLANDKLRDRNYEQANTYSNLVSVAHPALNLLLLNFSYHNAHHDRPTVPWHDLPTLHAQLFPKEYTQIMPMADLVRGYHRDRIKRIISEDYGKVGIGATRAERFLGAAGVSFLIAA